MKPSPSPLFDNWGAWAVFERMFKQFRLPDAIRPDNGVPSALYRVQQTRGGGCASASRSSASEVLRACSE